ncbi:MAG TPA: Flp pilus assembly protein CpaB [Rhizomicrobium sp.]|jgi:pilus assembly protein CpaB|nr:Flp pilus assembly protein CpaB [Rhizomicrobium sp.]
MNMPRMLVLGLAGIAAIAAVLILRAMMGGGTPNAAAMLPRSDIPTAEVLVAAEPLQPGEKLTAAQVRWEKWPKSDIDATYLTHEQVPNVETAMTGAVARAPMVAGEPLTTTKFVHADTAGFLAATLQPGMRAVSIPITTDSGAGGFILPNDRVDLIGSEQISDTPRRFRAKVVLQDVRVLAMDQNFKQDKDQKVVLAKTATLELTPDQARQVVKWQAAGPLSLSLRALGDNSKPAPTAQNQANSDDGDTAADYTSVRVIRFGVTPTGSNGRKDAQ